MNRIKRVSIVLGLLTALAQPAALYAQASSSTPKDEPSTEIIDAPPATATPPQTPQTGVVLDRPGRVWIHGQPLRIRFQSPTEGVSFHLRTGGSYSSISGVSFGAGWGWGGYGWGPGWGPGWGWGGYGVAPYYGEVVTRAYQPICETPCDATLLSGRHRFALSLGGNRPIEVAQPVELTANSIVEGRYVDRSHLRKAGWAVFAAGAIAGMALMFGGVNYDNDPFAGQQIRFPGMFYSGVGLFISSIIAGSVLAAQDDHAYVNIYPAE